MAAAPGGPIPPPQHWTDVQVKVNPQRWWLDNGQMVNLVVSSNSASGTHVMALVENGLHQDNCMLSALGWVQKDDWRWFMRKYQEDRGVPDANQRFAGPRASDNSHNIYIEDAQIIGLQIGHPLSRGLYPNLAADDYVTVRLWYN